MESRESQANPSISGARPNPLAHPANPCGGQTMSTPPQPAAPAAGMNGASGGAQSQRTPVSTQSTITHRDRAGLANMEPLMARCEEERWVDVLRRNVNGGKNHQYRCRGCRETLVGGPAVLRVHISGFAAAVGW